MEYARRLPQGQELQRNGRICSQFLVRQGAFAVTQVLMVSSEPDLVDRVVYRMLARLQRLQHSASKLTARK